MSGDGTEDMRMMMPMMVIVMVGVVVGIALLGSMLAGGRLLPPRPAAEDPRPLEQAERIEMLEAELRRVQDQADFTERLLTERSRPRPADAAETDGPSAPTAI